MPIDRKRYPPNWTEIAARIKARYGHKCTRCGATDVQLGCAHLDHDETNWDVKDERLATMCQACHLAYDRPDNLNRAKYGQDYRKTMPLIPFPDGEFA